MSRRRVMMMLQSAQDIVSRFIDRVALSGGILDNQVGLSSVDESSALTMLPNAYKDGTLYSVLPEDASGDFDVVRGSGATRVNSLGQIELITSTNTPRIDYTSGSPVLLVEPQTTQLLTYSEDFSQWVSGGSTTIQSGYLAPDGTTTAYKVSGSGSALSLAAGLTATTTRSIYARTVSGTGQANLCSYNSNTNNLFTITEEWQRFDVNSANATGVTTFYAVDFRGGTTLSEIILWGANATNDQDYATSYIPTTGVIATRLEDVITVDLTSLSVSSITETIDGVEQTPITSIPSTYTIPQGNINKIVMI